MATRPEVWPHREGGQVSYAIGIVGSHHWHDYDAFCLEVAPYIKNAGVIVSGGARGVDTMAARLARDLGIPYTDYPVEQAADETWTKAEKRRDQQIVDAVHALIAMPGPKSKDTWDTIRRARKKGIEVVRIEAPV